jgi:SAM-dependent methyltransferase
VSKLDALEPNPEMIRLAERQRRQTELNVEYLSLPGERIPLGDGTVDTVVSTFTLCTVPGVAEVSRGIGHVMKPGGLLIFFENALSPDRRVRRWQERWEPVLRRVFAGLRLTRDIPSLITRGEFQIERAQKACLAAFPRSGTYCCCGTARSSGGEKHRPTATRQGSVTAAAVTPVITQAVLSQRTSTAAWRCFWSVCYVKAVLSISADLAADRKAMMPGHNGRGAEGVHFPAADLPPV